MSVIRQRTKNLLAAGLMGILIASVFFGGVFTYILIHYNRTKQNLSMEYEAKIREAQGVREGQKMVRVAFASQNITTGSRISKENVEFKMYPEEQAPSNFMAILGDFDGKVAKIDISKNSAVTASMLFEEKSITKDVRNQEFQVISLPSGLMKNQYVDVRINFPTGQDYIVLSKKKVKDVKDTTVWYELNESEILHMSSAIVDAYLQGAKLYALTYVEPYLQEEAVANYPANLKVLDLIRSDPNIVQVAATELASKTRQALDLHLKEISDPEKMKVINEQQKQQNEKMAEQTRKKQEEVMRQSVKSGL
ncbi:Flp pilus assembly protein CpaB [Paenibacillus larvae subsp. larvae]|uniref:Flp pilus assembly protein CpaB n=1 Tax=Paenibacillus larvae subsp. larvae TaxID=147375 RepID=A0A2L1U2J4_9BACL|nr:SAF domain-containing protein [Paenibacillus larvae]AQT83787.1 hypothetical protein B1222_04205 [Paenibacillus larvae subsp. pulvifaciens]AQZ45215.1 hypothetical protein B5S25_00050 [Paenibacillus larvae subsp. pulvifaciens]AVF27141.1 Flp pilus assembly protein CpaB [Paenibacillus larvae subsp. larvae]AVF31802.1 Flp pilus assembly protein CpaB [Paenibacillus larvae subsp. larvae]MCY7520193.1 SAF domain-containing protein [Paenibacillus larvae]